MKDLLLEFHEKLSAERIQKTSEYEHDILKCYHAIIDGLIVDYDTYHKYVPSILDSLEKNGRTSISYSLHVFDHLLNKLLKQQDYFPFDKSVINVTPSDDSVENCQLIMETNLKKNNEPRLSEDSFDTCDISTQEKKEIVSLIIDKLQFDAVKVVWSKEIVESNLMLLYPLRSLASELGNLSLFYLPTGIFLDHLCLSEYHQQARDFAEELLICSYNDDLLEYGFLASFRIYSNQKSVQAAFLYGNLLLLSLLIKKPPYSGKLIQELIWQTIKFTRNLGLHAYVEKYYNSIPPTLEVSAYERRAIDLTYFTSLLNTNTPAFPQILLDYLHKERESILNGNIPDCTPWLILLYNVKRIYKDADFSSTGLGFYLTIFEQIVPAENIKRFKDIIHGSVSELKEYLKESYIKLMETASVSDVEYDNSTALTIANRIVESSFKAADFEAILLSMVVKSDYSLVHKSKNSSELTPFVLPDMNTKALFEEYSIKDNLISALILDDLAEIIWLTEAEGKLFQMSLFNNEFHFDQVQGWDPLIFSKLKETEYFSSFSFQSTGKDRYGSVYEITPEEYLDESNKVKEIIAFSKVTSHDSKSVSIVKDMEVSSFPHNLMLDTSNEFLFLAKPITNILSTEWYHANINFSPINKEFTKSIWIPTEGGDSTLNYLSSNLEECIEANSFDFQSNLSIEKPLSADINIVGSHGAKDISSIQVISTGGTLLSNLNTVIGPGKVLIFFVCHSGSQSSDFFKNSVSSLVKEYIAQGYQAVIAPAWALRVDVPPIWLPVFIEALNNGETISLAHHKANLAVYKKFPTPAAWACLHLFGNPEFRVQK